MNDRRQKDPHARTKAPQRGTSPEGRPQLSLGKKLLFSAVTVLAVLALCELAARLFVRVAPDSRWARHSTLVDAVGFPSLNEILIPHAERFWTTRPRVMQKKLSGRVASGAPLDFVVSTDEEGCRMVPRDGGAPEGAPYRGTGGSALVAFLGDSTTFGVGVNDGETYPALLEQRIPGVRTVNLGVPGYTAYQGRLRLESFPFTSPPRVLVVTFGFNDAASWDDVGDLQHAERMAAEQGRLVNRSRFLSLLSALLRRPASSDATGEVPAARRRPRLTDAEFAGELGGIVSWCRSRGVAPVLLVWPQRPQLATDLVSPKQRMLLRIGAADPGVQVVNLVPVFRANGGETLFADMIHANTAGNRTVADAIEPIVRKALGMPVIP